MTLLDQLNEDMKQAMRNKDKERLSVIRMVKSSLQNEAINTNQQSLSKEDELTILSKELKQRKDSLQEFEQAGRDDLVHKLKTEINVLNAYMPEQLSTNELDAMIQETITETGATSPGDMGKVMSAIMPKVRGRADGALVNQRVQKHLQEM